MFSKFRFFGLIGGWRAKNGSKWQKFMSVTVNISGSIYRDFWYTCVKWWHLQVLLSFFCLLHSVSQELYLIYDCGFWYTCVKWWHLQVLLSFFCLAHSVSQEPYLIYDCGFWYTCVKWWYLQQLFSFLKNSNFWVFRGRVKRQKMTRYDQFQSVTFYISRTLDHIIKIFSTQV